MSFDQRRRNQLHERVVHISVTLLGQAKVACKVMNPESVLCRLAALIAVCLTLTLSGCAGHSDMMRAGVDPAFRNPNFKPIEKSETATLLSKEDMALLEETLNPVYHIGSGDVLKLDVFGRPEVSGTHVVGPDGKITVPIVGDVFLNEFTREAALDTIDKRLHQFFTQPHATLSVEQYTSNQVTVLGRVERAGIQRFPHPPTLAEVLAGAGAMPIMDKQATLTRCAIMRGRDKLIWVDLKSLLNGDPSYNMRMKKGDIIYIPDSSDTAVYVMGAVVKPGSYRLTPRMTALDVLMQAGGPTEDAAAQQIGIYRAGAKQVEIVAMSDLVDVSRKANYALEDGDVIFIPKSSIAEFGYVMRQISPGITVLSIPSLLKNL
jgi:polysaccharide export outer membrane protein